MVLTSILGSTRWQPNELQFLVEQHFWFNNIFVFLIPGPIIEELNHELKDLEVQAQTKAKSQPEPRSEVLVLRRVRLLGKQAPSGWYKFSWAWCWGLMTGWSSLHLSPSRHSRRAQLIGFKSAFVKWNRTSYTCCLILHVAIASACMQVFFQVLHPRQQIANTNVVSKKFEPLALKKNLKILKP